MIAATDTETVDAGEDCVHPSRMIRSTFVIHIGSCCFANIRCMKTMTKRNAVAVNVPHYEDIKGRAGHFIWTGLHGVESGGPYGMMFACPCGCGQYGSVHFDLPAVRAWGADHNTRMTMWQWDGNKEKPTLSPSIMHDNHWHGYLRAGVFEEC